MTLYRIVRTREATIVDRQELRAVSLSTIALYSGPSFCMSFVAIVVAFYFNKFATDVLLVAPGVIGSIHGIARIWDAISDPLVGYLSDRTQSPMGRRRPWAIFSILPLSVFVAMLWMPPAALSEAHLIAWLLVAYLGYETARTTFLVPWSALGLELTQRYEERTRLFGWKHLFILSGALCGFLVYLWLSRAENPRSAVFQYAILSILVFSGVTFWAVRKISERGEFQSRPAASPWRACVDVLRNPPSRFLLFLFAAESMGIAATFSLVPYVADYVLERSDLAAVIGLSYMLPQALLVPLCIARCRQIEKSRLWMLSMAASSVLFAVQAFYGPETPTVVVGLVSASLGVAAGLGAVCAEAIQADVVDYDEYRTGGRKEGAYVAFGNIAGKLPSGLTPFLALGAMELSGYVPNQAQSDRTKEVLLLFFSLFPAACFALGCLALTQMKLSRSAHEHIQSMLGREERMD